MMDNNHWGWCDTGSNDPDWNMAFDDALLDSINDLNTLILRFYQWEGEPATFGYFQKYDQVQQQSQLRPLIRRPTGGGLVEHASDWTYSVAIPVNHPWYKLRAQESYQRIHNWCVRALIKLGINSTLSAETNASGPGQCFVGAEKDDVLVAGKKVAGAAQRRNKKGLLIQGSVQVPDQSEKRLDWVEAMLSSSNEQWIKWDHWEKESFIERVEGLRKTKYSNQAFLALR